MISPAVIPPIGGGYFDKNLATSIAAKITLVSPPAPAPIAGVTAVWGHPMNRRWAARRQIRMAYPGKPNLAIRSRTFPRVMPSIVAALD